jgi:YesN/AraC family two-component response regulator
MNTNQPIRVLIVDDHAMVRKGLTSFLKNEPALELVGEARDGREAIEACENRSLM